MKNRDFLKLLALAGGVLAVCWAWRKFSGWFEGDPNDEDFDQYCCDDDSEDMTDVDIAYNEGYDVGFADGMHADYHGNNEAAQAWQEAYDDSREQEYPKEDCAEDGTSDGGEKTENADADDVHEDRRSIYNEAGRLGSASE